MSFRVASLIRQLPVFADLDPASLRSLSRALRTRHADPGEAVNLAASNPEVRDRLHARLRGWRAGIGAPMPVAIEVVDGS